MPELAEVEFFRKQWNSGLRQRILTVHLHAGKRIFRGLPVMSMRRGIAGKNLLSSHAHGKQMLFRIGPSGWLGIHLGMTGKLSTQPAAYPPGPHDHLILRTRRHSLVFHDPRLFGRVRFDHHSKPPDWWSQLPPPILSRNFHLQKFKGIFQRHPRAPLKALLLRQECFPGLGNWMADEILWQSHLHPKTSGRILRPAQLEKLYASIRKVCREALQTIGRDWSDPPKGWLFRHRWKPGGQCPRCAIGLARASVGGRTTCWCPACQPPLPRRANSA
ncbi:MAG: Fpg/Nei family DNA glycosylase [Verrucomicrobia bacterium]|nr:Fpg/Nei family DNA glycosylase [Verrucomicrobiota bacterium]